MKEKINQFAEILKKSKKILLINHIRMDPDAFSGLVGFYHILENIGGYTIKATNNEKPSDDFLFLGNNHIFEIDLDINEYNPDLIISFDAASLDQLGKKYLDYKYVFEKKDFVVIDHHLTNSGFGKLNIIDIKSSSTCELVFEIIETLNFEKYITPEIATILTTGLLTDTNIYYNSNTTPKTLETGAKLMRYGADFRKPMFEFYKKKDFDKTKLWGEVLKDIKKSKNAKIVWAIITDEMFKKTNTSEKQVSGLINEFLSNIDGSEVCFLAYPLDNGQVKVSMRSWGFDVSSICARFGGGGHKQASGFSTNKNLEEIEKELIELLIDLDQ